MIFNNLKKYRHIKELVNFFIICKIFRCHNLRTLRYKINRHELDHFNCSRVI